MKQTVFMAATLLALAGCDSDKGGADKADGEKSGGDSSAVSDEDLDKADDIPVEEDFEEAAASDINEDNLDDKVAALESEIAGDE
jgi:hypothetical protein